MDLIGFMVIDLQYEISVDQEKIYLELELIRWDY